MIINKSAIFGEVLGVVISLVVAIYLMPRLSFVTDSYSIWLPISIVTTLIDGTISVIKHLFTKPTKYLFELLAILPAMYSIYKLIEIFPFDFSLVGYPAVNAFVRIALQLVLVALSFAILANLVKFLKIEDDKEVES